jgi:hypothetical protein
MLQRLFQDFELAGIERHRCILARRGLSTHAGGGGTLVAAASKEARMKTAIATALLLCIVGTAHADMQPYPDAITFGPSFAAGPPPGFPWGPVPAVGSPAVILAVVSDVGAPFTGLLPAGAHELTLVLDNATFASMGYFDGDCSGGPLAAYEGGVLSLYLDVSPDADFTNPPTFRDGELVIHGGIEFFWFAESDPGESCYGHPDDPDIYALFDIVGGSWFPGVGGGNAPYGVFKGELTGHNPDNVPDELKALGYVLRIDGVMDIFAPVATQPTTWGRVKAMYR